MSNFVRPPSFHLLDGDGRHGYPGAMRVVHGRQRLVAELGRPLRAPTVAIGNFDGVHRGHQALIGASRDRARASGGEVVVLTFDPHPARFFAPDLAPPMITSLARRLELLAAAGAGVTIIEPFDATFAALAAEHFVETVLRDDIGARHVVVGYDFTFGRGRQGAAPLLSALGERLGMGVTVIPAVDVGGVVCSSTKIREFVLEGRVEGARLLLGRPFEITGEVVRGAGRGRTLGIPTANLRPEGELLPRAGIYAARARRLAADRRASAAASGAPEDQVPPREVRPAAVSVGTNPTFVEGNSEVTVEAHLLDFDGDLYGTRLELALETRLRDERRFASVDELMREIHRDIARTREIIS
jgi:riboflavin kinase / FMN adenylyltransferase